MVIASCSLDNVLTITSFGIVLGFVFVDNSLSLAYQIVKGPLEVVLGVSVGIVLGYMIRVFPLVKNLDQTTERLLMTLATGTAAVMIPLSVSLSSTGVLAVLTMAFIAGCDWRSTTEMDVSLTLEKQLRSIWVMFAQPFLFALIGTEVSLTYYVCDQLFKTLAIDFWIDIGKNQSNQW